MSEQGNAENDADRTRSQQPAEGDGENDGEKSQPQEHSQEPAEGGEDQS
ncbi:hypothetical protein [Arthrobacter yangruifuii]|nr:hypothetical protein [Arthrobacter yangruifuii]